MHWSVGVNVMVKLMHMQLRFKLRSVVDLWWVQQVCRRANVYTDMCPLTSQAGQCG